MSSQHSALRALAAGFAGAVAVTLIHEATRKALGGTPGVDKHPRLDRLGQKALTRTMNMVGITPPDRGPKRYLAALVGDIAVNSVLYGLTTRLMKPPLVGGVVSGIAAGISGLLLPKLMGLGREAGTTAQAKAITFADYTVGGVVTGAVLDALDKD